MDSRDIEFITGQEGLQFTDVTGQDWVVLRNQDPPYLTSDRAVAIGGKYSGKVVYVGLIPNVDFI